MHPRRMSVIVSVAIFYFVFAIAFLTVLGVISNGELKEGGWALTDLFPPADIKIIAENFGNGLVGFSLLLATSVFCGLIATVVTYLLVWMWLGTAKNVLRSGEDRGPSTRT